MRAVVFYETGGPEVLQFREDWPEPVPGPGEVLVRVRACGVNRLDIYLRTGRVKTSLPHIAGSEVAGEVVQLGEGVVGVPIGQRVAVHPYLHDGTCEFCLQCEEGICLQGDILGLRSDGGFAEYVRVPANSLVPLPDDVSFDDAAAVTLSTLTAWHMLITKAQLRPGETVLVHAAGSGVGSAAVQIAKLVGARVIATAGTDEKARRAIEIGADEAINYNKADFQQEVRRLTNKRGVDVVVEHVGQTTWEKSIGSLARNGRLVTAGATTGNEGRVDIWALFAKQLRLIGCYGGTKYELVQVLRLVERGELVPVIFRKLPLEAVPEAQRLLEERAHFGKIVINP